MRVCWVWFFLLLAAVAPARAACVEPSAFLSSTVSLNRTLAPVERTTPGVVGINGTGWFLSSRLIVTASHVAESMHLSATDWKRIEIKERDKAQYLLVRILRIVGSDVEKIAVLESISPIDGATPLELRPEPLVPDEHVISLAYPNSHLRFAGGRFIKYGADGRLAGTALFELHDGDDRLVLDYGASGAPVIDCEGRVVAVVTITMTQTVRFQSRVLRISTPWNSPNVVSIPVTELKGFSG